MDFNFSDSLATKQNLPLKMKEISSFNPHEFSLAAKDENKPFFIMPSEFYGVMVMVVDRRKAIKAAGNPYPKRGQIKKKIFGDFGDWIASVCSSVDCDSAAEKSEDDNLYFLRSSNHANGYYPYNKRGQIKVRIFKELFKQIPA